MDDAVRVAAEILERWAPILVGLELRSGTRGVFRVTVDDDLIFDKRTTGHTPRPGELSGLLEPRLGPPLTWRRSRAV
jgi:predicted Rdx family selenoprotein